MNKQQEVIQAIRKQLNHLTEIKRDCILEKDSELLIVNDVLDGDEGKFANCSFLGDDWFRDTQVDIARNEFKVIGKEPTILDALDCLNLVDEFLGIGFDGEILEWIDGREYGILNKKIRFDLSKPLIKDQSEETINFLHSVLC